MVDLVKKISNGSRVTLHFSLSLADEQVIDSNFNKEPASFKIGDGSLLPEFENLLIGEHEGAATESTLFPKAFGDKNPENIQRFAAEKFTHLLEDDVLPTETGSVEVLKTLLDLIFLELYLRYLKTSCLWILIIHYPVKILFSKRILSKLMTRVFHK